ncbi:hypothetical protein D3C72_2096510 [compost metagenome]
MSPVAGSSGIWPEKYTVLSARTACEYGPMAAGAFSVLMIWRDMGRSGALGENRAVIVPGGGNVGGVGSVSHQETALTPCM